MIDISCALLFRCLCLRVRCRHVCMSDSICMCVRVFVCGYVFMFECLMVWMCASMYVCMSVYVIIYACMLVCLYRSRVHACVYAHVCACILRAPKYTCQHTPIHAPWQDYSRNPPPHDLCTVIWFIHNSSPPTSPSFYFRIVCVCMRDTHKHTHAYTHTNMYFACVVSIHSIFILYVCVRAPRVCIHTHTNTYINTFRECCPRTQPYFHRTVFCIFFCHLSKLDSILNLL